MSNYKLEKKKRDTMQKYNNYFLFERNIAFFFNFVIQKFIGLETPKLEGQLKLLYLVARN